MLIEVSTYNIISYKKKIIESLRNFFNVVLFNTVFYLKLKIDQCKITF